MAFVPLVAALWLASSSGLVAQDVGGTIFGRVGDESGKALPSATVSARNLNTGLTRVSPTDAGGLYRLVGLPVGMYEMTIAASGFATEVRSGVRVMIGQQSELNFALKVAAVAETVSVQAEVPIVESTKSAIGVNITTREIDELPLTDRNFTTLAFLSPGVTQSVTETTNISAAGSNGSANTFLIDGVSNDQDALGDLRGDYSPDAIGEYEVLSSQYSAEYGQASGAIINVVTRSGGNTFHARAAGYYRNDGLAATDPFAQKDPDTGEKEKTPFTQWIMSLSGGGPIVKDKAFFFGSYEQTWRDETAVVAVDPALLESLGLPVETAVPRTLREPRVVAKFDFHLTDSQTLMARFRYDEPKTTNDTVGAVAGGGVIVTSQAGFTLDTTNTDYVASHSWVMSPDTLNEARFQYARQNNDALEVNCPGCPTIQRPSLISGKLPNFPQSFSEDRYQVLDTASFNILGGNHFVKAGFDYSRVNIKAFVPQNFDGVFVFTTDAPFDANNQDTYPFIWQGGSGDPNIKIRNNIVGLFVQDQWRAACNLTFNIGLRWDYEDQVYTKHDWNNFGPRIHFAWDPFYDGRTSVRGGFGIYYDQVLLNVPLLATIFEPGRFNFQTILFPGYPDPLVGGAQIPVPLPPNISILDRNNQTPYKNVGSLGIQRELAPDMAISADAVYARSYHLLMLRDNNAPTGFDPATGYQYPDPSIGVAYEPQTRGRGEYMALQLGFTKRFGKNVGAQLAYTLARNRDNTDGSQYTPSDNYNIDLDYGPSSNDIRHTLNAAIDWRGPWGIVLGTSGSLLSSPPYNIITGLDDNNDTYISDRPAGEKRNSGRGATLWTVNVRLAKSIAIGPTELQLIMEAFNVFNHTNPTNYIGNMQSSLFRQPTASAPGAFGPRQIQFGIRLDL
ncbi:MAG TPA: TonB-dependent receptor [Thermoanaerobaculia bacterium]